VSRLARHTARRTSWRCTAWRHARHSARSVHTVRVLGAHTAVCDAGRDPRDSGRNPSAHGAHGARARKLSRSILLRGWFAARRGAPHGGTWHGCMHGTVPAARTRRACSGRTQRCAELGATDATVGTRAETSAGQVCPAVGLPRDAAYRAAAHDMAARTAQCSQPAHGARTRGAHDGARHMARATWQWAQCVHVLGARGAGRVREQTLTPRSAARPGAPHGGARRGYKRGTVPATCERCAFPRRTRRCAVLGATHVAMGAVRRRTGRACGAEQFACEFWTPRLAARPDTQRGGARRDQAYIIVPGTYARCARSRRTQRWATLGATQATVGAVRPRTGCARAGIIRERILPPRSAARPGAPHGGARCGHKRGTVPATRERRAFPRRTRRCAALGATQATVGAVRPRTGRARGGNNSHASSGSRGSRRDPTHSAAAHGVTGRTSQYLPRAQSTRVRGAHNDGRHWAQPTQRRARDVGARGARARGNNLRANYDPALSRRDTTHRAAARGVGMRATQWPPHPHGARVSRRTRRCTALGATQAAVGAGLWRTGRGREGHKSRVFFLAPRFAARHGAPHHGQRHGCTHITMSATRVRCACRGAHNGARHAVRPTRQRAQDVRTRGGGAREGNNSPANFIPRSAARPDAPRGGARRDHTRGTVPATRARCACPWRRQRCATRSAIHATGGAGRRRTGARARGK
jgi:hypothetical protein